MRTCSKCGCYIPDNWTTCPACHSQEKTEIKKDTVGIFRVDTFYYNHRSKSNEFFNIYENAERYAIRRLAEPDVTAAQIFQRGRIIKTFFSSSY